MTGPSSRLYDLELVSPVEFDAIVDSLAGSVYVPFEQSGIWTRMMDGSDPGRSEYGYIVMREHGELVALMRAEHFQRKIRSSIVSLTGPVFVAERTPEAERRFVETLANHLKRDPSVDPMYIRMGVAHPEAIPGTRLAIERGIFDREVIVPLANTPEDLKKTFSSTTRNLINRGRRNRVEVREITENRSEFFSRWCFPIFEETAERDGFEVQPKHFFVRLLDVMPENVRLYATYLPAAEGEPAPEAPVAWAISNEYHGRGSYYFAGSTKAAQKAGVMPVMLNRLLLDLRASGNTAAGLTGIGSEIWPELRRLERFKLSFSKEIAEYPPLHDVPLKPAKYAALRAWLTARQKGPAAARSAVSRMREAAQRARRGGASQEPLAHS
ncbi:lipid II:glycine glycyltransferase FemX [Falsarthrobacter nasiphocae]|uniref:FemAB family protein n=1 Tax=Falsarthrobacter nasiphocae TaxID=189863 RepID=A0AAE3YH13_9MICC|nr:peptidoglycan bridge formation glycyltransferase FemA/FemB family protein [Falsarthrobacter nasiphocae]MDR6892054.1 hypothetical protein [Falsarthrobacter nasiphocae]